MKDYTSNGIMFTEEIASINGASFILFPSKEHTKEQINAAKRELRRERDVVSLKIADDYDRDELFKSDYFRDPRTRPLKWYEIEQDEKLIRRERIKGTTPEQFVTEFVLPFVDQVRERNKEKYKGKKLDM